MSLVIVSIYPTHHSATLTFGRYCNLTLFDPLDPRRRAPVEKTALEYLIYTATSSPTTSQMTRPARP